MIDLTPLDVRKKRGDFKKLMRGYDPQEVDVFLELVAERLEALVRENLQLRERTQTLQQQVDAQVGREQAVQDALVTAQELRADIQAQSQREADHIRREAQAEAKRVIAEAEAESRRLIAEAEGEVRSRLRGIERQLDHARDSIAELERRRVRFLKEFRSLLEREMDVVEVEEDREPYQERAIDLDLGGRRRGSGSGSSPAPDLGAATLVTTEAVEGAGEAAPTESSPIDPSADDGPAADPTADAESSPSVEGAGPSGPEPEAAADADGSDSAPVAFEIDLTPEVDAAAPSTDGSAAGDTQASVLDPAPTSSADPEEPTVDVAALGPSADGASARPSAPPPAVPTEPSTLELELMAGAGGDEGEDGRRFPDVPDLETLLAEAGVEEAKAPRDIAPPPAPGVPKDHVILFDPNDPDRRR